MTTSELDPDAMVVFCRKHVPGLLRELGVDAELANVIADDVLGRAMAFAALDRGAQAVLTAPFAEEVFGYEPKEANRDLKAAVSVVVRNSKLEIAHANDGKIKAGGIEGITTIAAAPLSHLLAAHRDAPSSEAADRELFAALSGRYPRAWSCCAALADALPTGGRHGYRLPEAAVPELPPESEWVDATQTDTTDQAQASVLSAIDPRFDRYLAEQLSLVVEHQAPFFVPTLSRISRNQDRLLHVLEYLLAHGITIVTTNYMLRQSDVWVRRHPWVQPDSYDSTRGLHDLRGLSGSHRQMVSMLSEALA